MKKTLFGMMGMAALGLTLAGCAIDTSERGGATKAAAPIASPQGGKVPPGTEVTLATATPGAKIYYTVNGSEPTTKSAVYSDPIEVKGAGTIRAFAAKKGMGNSDPIKAGYTLTPKVSLLDLTSLIPITTAAMPEVMRASVDTAQYTGTVSWTITGGGSVSGVFLPNTFYTARLALEVKEGWTFIGLGAKSFFHSLASGVVNAGGGEITVTFPKTASGTVTAANLQTYLQGLPDNTEAAPYTVALQTGTVINAGGVWQTVNNAVQTAGKAVFLDVSACDADNLAIYGNYNSSPNDMNKIRGNQYIKGIILPNTLTAIGQYSFFDCAYLPSVSIPANVTAINSSAFQNCADLTGITIPAGISVIENRAFYGAGLVSVIIEDGVIAIGNYAFQNCTQLTGVTIPSSVVGIGQQAFYDCTGLTGVTIPVGVSVIGDEAFGNCTALVSVTLDGNIPSADFAPTAFPEGPAGTGGDSLRTAYFAGGGGPGTYTRAAGRGVWSKQE